MHRTETKIIGGIVLLGLVLAALMSAINGTWRNTSFRDYSDDSDTYNRTAVLLLDRWSFHDEQSLYVGMQRRSPGYPVFLALIYGAFGRAPVAVFAMQALLFAGSIVLLWLLARMYFSPPYSFLPPLFLALSWPMALFVTKLETELLSLFLLLVFVYFLQRFFISQKYALILVAGAAISWFLLIKPAALYLLPFIAAHVALRARGEAAKTLALLMIVPALLVGAWMVRSIVLFDTWQVQSGSFVLGYRGLEVTNSWERVKGAFMGALLGDIVADKFSPGYAQNPEPYPSINATTERFVALGKEGLTEKEREDIVYNEAWSRIAQNPIKFLVFGVIGLLRQNTPLNHKGYAITHTFAEGGYEYILEGQKIALLIGIRILWYAFLAAVLYGAAITARDWRRWGIIFIWIFGYNILYAFFTHNEARYMVPLFPFYFMFFTAALFAMRRGSE